MNLVERKSIESVICAASAHIIRVQVHHTNAIADYFDSINEEVC